MPAIRINGTGGGLTDYASKAAVNRTPKYGGLYGLSARVITIAGVLYQWTGTAIQAISVGATDAAPVAPPSAPTISAAPGAGQNVLTLSALIGGNTRTLTSTVSSVTTVLPVGAATSYTDTGLTGGLLATYAVYDTNATGDSPTATATATPGSAGGPVFNATFAQASAVHYVLQYGQSLGRGQDSIPLLSTTSHKRNIAYGQNIASTTNTMSYFANLITESTTEMGMYASMDTVDRLASAQMGLLTKKYVQLAANTFAVSGQAYASLSKGNASGFYATMLNSLIRTVQAYTAVSQTMIVPGVFFVHGEADEGSSNAAYGANLLTLWTDLNTDIKAATGQTQDIVMYISQTASYCYYNHTFPTTDQQMYLAAKANPTKIVLVGSKYHLLHSDVNRVHILGDGTRAFLGEKHGQALYQTQYTDKPFKAVMPSASPTGALSGTITAAFQTNGGNLALDTTNMPAHTNTAYGFEVIYQDATAAPAITAVSVAGTTATVTLASALTKAAYLRYAWTTPTTGISGNALTSQKPGPPTGVVDIGGNYGNLRDSDAFASQYGYLLGNWAVTFQEAIV